MTLQFTNDLIKTPAIIYPPLTEQRYNGNHETQG